MKPAFPSSAHAALLLALSLVATTATAQIPLRFLARPYDVEEGETVVFSYLTIGNFGVLSANGSVGGNSGGGGGGGSGGGIVIALHAGTLTNTGTVQANGGAGGTAGGGNGGPGGNGTFLIDQIDP